MRPNVICGSDLNKQRSKDGCGKYFNHTQITRCWHCGFAFCDDCYRLHYTKVIKKEGRESHAGDNAR